MKETLAQTIATANSKLGSMIYKSDIKGSDGIITASNGEGIDYLVMNGSERELMIYMRGVVNGINSMIQKQMIEEESNGE